MPTVPRAPATPQPKAPAPGLPTYPQINPEGMVGLAAAILATGAPAPEAMGQAMAAYPTAILRDLWPHLLAPHRDRLVQAPLATVRAMWGELRPWLPAALARTNRKPLAGLREAIEATGLHPICLIAAEPDLDLAQACAETLLGHGWAKTLANILGATTLHLGRLAQREGWREWPAGLTVLPCKSVALGNSCLERIAVPLFVEGYLALSDNSALTEISAPIHAGEALNLRHCIALRALAPVTTPSLNLDGCQALEALPTGLRLDHLNIRGCEALRSFPDDIRAKTLIRSRHLGGAHATEPLSPGIGTVI